MTKLDDVYCEECRQMVSVDLSDGVFVVDSDGKTCDYGAGESMPKLHQKYGWHVKSCNHHLELIQHHGNAKLRIVK